MNTENCNRCGIEKPLNQIYAGGNCWSCNQPEVFQKRPALGLTETKQVSGLEEPKVQSSRPRTEATFPRFAVLRKTTHGRRSRTTDVALGVRSFGWHLTNGRSCASLTLTGKLGESYTVCFDIQTFDAIGEIVNKHRATSNLNTPAATTVNPSTKQS